MKRRDLVKKLESAGWYLKRHGDEHDIYKNDNPADKQSTQYKSQDTGRWYPPIGSNQPSP